LAISNVDLLYPCILVSSEGTQQTLEASNGPDTGIFSTVKCIQDDCLQRFDSNPIYRGALLHNLYMMTDSCIALA
jgi:hypothetical protein